MKLVEKNNSVFSEVKIENPVVSGTKFPYVLDDVPGDVLPKPCPVLLEKLDVEGNLIVLDAGIFACYRFLLQVIEKLLRLHAVR